MARAFHKMNDQIDDSLSCELDPPKVGASPHAQTPLPDPDLSSTEVCLCDETVLPSNSETSDKNSRAETADFRISKQHPFVDNSYRNSPPVEIQADCKFAGEQPDVCTCMGQAEQNSNEGELGPHSSRFTHAGDIDGEHFEASAMLNQYSYRDEQYSQASICSCFCTCEPYEEMNAMYETEESMPVCVQCEELSESECMASDSLCSCDDSVVIVRPLYAVHCCTCGVQLAHGSEPSIDVPGAGPDEAAAEDVPTPDDSSERVPVPPPPPSQSSYLFLGSRLTRMPERGHGPSSGSVPRGAIAATPALLLRALSCDDGSQLDSRLHEAARAGQAEKLAALLQDDDLKPCINSRARPLMATPLREAVVGASDECVRLLLSAGAAVDAVDIKGQTPLLMAASLSRPAIVETLLRAGANPEGDRSNTCTPLLLAIREGCVASLKSLLHHGVNPEPLSVLRTCTPGWPLQYCVVFRRLDCFLELLKGGAEPSLALVLARGGQNMTDVDEPILRRLSIVRSVLQHASDMPEFIRVYHEFGGPCHISALPDDLRMSTSPARQELQAVLDIPPRLSSLCRMSLLRVAGVSCLPRLAAAFGLPAQLRAYLAFADLDRYVAHASDQSNVREP